MKSQLSRTLGLRCAAWLMVGCACAPTDEPQPTTSVQSEALKTVFATPPSNITVDTVPLDGSGALLYEPVAVTRLESDDQYLVNGYVQIRNSRSDTIELDRATFRPASGPAQSWNEAALLAELDDRPERSRLMGGGWARVGFSAEVPEDEAYETLFDIVADGSQTFAAGVRHGSKDRFGVVRYDSGGLRTITKTTFGSWSAARAYGITHHDSSVVAVGSVESSAAYFAMARFDEDLELDTSFSGDGRLRFGMPGCGDEKLVDVIRHASSYYVAGHGHCNGVEQGAIARVSSSGTLRTDFDGDGIRTLGFWTSDVEAVSLAGYGSWIYVAGNIGASCDPLKNSAKSCVMFVARMNATTGALDANFGNVGVYEIIQPGSGENQGASAITIDAYGRPVVTGWTEDASGELWLTTVRLRASGGLDTTFNGVAPGGYACPTCGGVVKHKLSGYEAIGRDLLVRADGTVAIAASVKTPASGQDFGLALLSGSGYLLESNNAFYGNGGEHANNIPAGITEDSSGRLVMAGRANRFVWASSDDRAASAAFLADGHLAKRTNIGPGESRQLYLHMPRFDEPVATSADIELEFAGFDPLVQTYDLRAHENGPEGSYRFPARQEDLPQDTYWYVNNEHMLGHNHVWSKGQRYAVDLTAVRYDDGVWTDRIDTAVGKPKAQLVNSDFVVWGTPVYAMDGGYIRQCWRTVPDNPYGEKITGGGGNMFYIDHDSGETVLYAHLQNGSVPPALCPTEGELPGPTYPRIEAGTQLGVVGNTGNSSGPHLHIDAQTGYGADFGVPLLFREVDVHHLTWPLNQWVGVHARGLTRADGETQMIVRPRPNITEPYCDETTGRIVNGPDEGELCGTAPGGPCADLRAHYYFDEWLFGVGIENPRWHPNGNDSFHTRCDFDSTTGQEMTCVREGQGSAVCKICGHGDPETYTELGCRPTGTCPAGTQLWPDGRCWDEQDDLPEWMCQADCETMYNGHGYCLNNIDWRMMMEDHSLTLDTYSWKTMPYNYYEPMCASWDCDGAGVACAAAGWACDPDPGTCVEECWSNADCAASDPPPAYPSSFICTNDLTCRL